MNTMSSIFGYAGTFCIFLCIVFLLASLILAVLAKTKSAWRLLDIYGLFLFLEVILACLYPDGIHVWAIAISLGGFFAGQIWYVYRFRRHENRRLCRSLWCSVGTIGFFLLGIAMGIAAAWTK